MTPYGELRAVLGPVRADEIEAMRERTRRRIVRSVAVFAAIAVAVVLLVFWIAQGNAEQNDQREALDGRVDDLESASSALATELNEANARLEAAGEAPASSPEDVVEDAAPGADAPIVIQGPTGPAGKMGDTGPMGPIGPPCDPTANPACRGPGGNDGQDGDDGDDGQDGAPCDPALNPACQGPPGSDGRGIVSQECVAGDYVTTYTDGTTATIEASPACPQPLPDGLTFMP